MSPRQRTRSASSPKPRRPSATSTSSSTTPASTASAPVDDFTEEDFHRHFNTNVLGLLQSTREALKIFNPEGGSVINVGSAVTKIHPPTTVVYTATKGAVDAITAVLANELAPRKIRVNSINPGGVETEGTVTAGVIGSDWEKQLVADTPLGRIGQPNDIAPLATFLASDDSGWLTGELLTASGGIALTLSARLQ